MIRHLITALVLVFSGLSSVHAAALTGNTITANGTYTVPTYLGKRYVFAVSGDFGGGSLAINWSDGSVSTAYSGSPATISKTFNFNAASTICELVLSGATAPSLTVSIALATGSDSSGINDSTQAALDAKSGIRRIVVVGDSNSSDGSGSATTSWAAYFSRHYLSNNSAFTNLAISGRTAAQIDAAHASQVTTISPATLGGSGYLFCLAGTNDLGVSSSPASTVLTLLRSIWTKSRTDGFKVVAFTIPKGSTITAGEETERLSLNTSIRADTTYWDFLVDLDQIFPNNLDTTYFLGDQLHFNAAGGKEVAINVRQTIDGGKNFFAPVVMARDVGTFSVPNGSVLTKIPYTNDGSSGGEDRTASFASGTFTAPIEGVYDVNFTLAVQNASTSIRWIVELYKNGSSWQRLYDKTSVDYMLFGATKIRLAKGDTLEIYASQNHSGSITVNSSNPASFFQIVKIHGTF